VRGGEGGEGGGDVAEQYRALGRAVGEDPRATEAKIAERGGAPGGFGAGDGAEGKAVGEGADGRGVDGGLVAKPPTRPKAPTARADEVRAQAPEAGGEGGPAAGAAPAPEPAPAPAPAPALAAKPARSAKLVAEEAAAREAREERARSAAEGSAGEGAAAGGVGRGAAGAAGQGAGVADADWAKVAALAEDVQPVEAVVTDWRVGQDGRGGVTLRSPAFGQLEGFLPKGLLTAARYKALLREAGVEMRVPASDKAPGRRSRIAATAFLEQVPEELWPDYLAGMVGTTVHVTVTRCEPAQSLLVCNERRAEAMIHRERVDAALEGIAPGMDVDFEVSAVRDRMGLFGTIAGGAVNGLVPQGEVSWELGPRPILSRAGINVGDVVKARILSVDAENRRVSCSIKALLQDPLTLGLNDLIEGDEAGSDSCGYIEGMDEYVTALREQGGVRAVEPGRCAEGKAIMLGFEVLIGKDLTAADGGPGYQMLVRSGLYVQELTVITDLDREGMREAIRRTTPIVSQGKSG